MTLTRDGAAKRLARVERQLRYAKACLDLLTHEAWKVIEDSMAAEEKAITDQLILSEKLSEHEAGMLKGGIRVLRWLQSLPRKKAERLQALTKEVEGLRVTVDRMQNQPRNRVSPDFQVALNNIRREVRT